MKRYSLRQSKCARDSKTVMILDPTLPSKPRTRNARKQKKSSEEASPNQGDSVSHKVSDNAFLIVPCTVQMKIYTQEKLDNLPGTNVQENSSTKKSPTRESVGRLHKKIQVSPIQPNQPFKPERKSLKRSCKNMKLTSIDGKSAAPSLFSPIQNACKTSVNKNVDITPMMLRCTASSQGSSDTSTPSSQSFKEKIEDDLFGFENLIQPTLNLNNINMECTVSPIPHARSILRPVEKSLLCRNNQRSKTNLRKHKTLRKSKHSKQEISAEIIEDKKENHEILLFGETPEQVDAKVDAANVFQEKNRSPIKRNKTRPRVVKTFSREKPCASTEPDIPWHEIMAHELVVE